MKRPQAWLLFLVTHAALVHGQFGGSPFSNQAPAATVNTSAVVAAATSTAAAITLPTDDADPTAAIDSSGYPIPSVPPTQSAPFMQKSSLPENFIFILVGGILGVLFASIVLWRAILAWKIKRTATRANHRSFYGVKKQGMSKLKRSVKPIGVGLTPERNNLLTRPHVKFYKQAHTRADSLEPLQGSTTNGPIYQENNRSSLFFSPTASPKIGERSSAYLPAGYYGPGARAADTASPVGATGRPVSAVDLTNVRVQYFPPYAPRVR